MVEAVDHTRQLRAVYKIRIPETHTYFVGSLEWGFSLACGSTTPTSTATAATTSLARRS